MFVVMCTIQRWAIQTMESKQELLSRIFPRIGFALSVA